MRSASAMDSRVSPTGLEKIWYLNDRGQIIGPMTWNNIKGMVNKRQVTPYAQIWEKRWPQWVPLTYYFTIKSPSDAEMESLMPSRYDAIFYLGVFVFILGVIGFIVDPFMGFILLCVSPIIEVTAIHLEYKHKGKTMIGAIGNAIAIVWIVVQVLVTIFLVMTLF